ncbi:MAG TPA: CARDB domain-containing protein, partial [Nitrospiria bacterium]|nr:CARDB domain-containing protein [Nitrospiria bacterium]
TITQGKTLAASNTVKNQGGFPAGGFTIGFVLSPTASYTDAGAVAITATRTVASLATGASSAAATTLTIPLTTPVGSYFLCALADSANTVAESIETNNSRCTSTSVTVSRPDLVMTAVTPAAATVSATATLSVSNTAKNQGRFAAGSFTIGFVLSPSASYTDAGAVALPTTRTVASLAVNASSAVVSTLAIPLSTPAGAYFVCAKADTADTAVELDETNNSLCSAGTVNVASPDLLLTAGSTTTRTIAQGKTLSVSTTVKNQGGFPAGSFTIAFALSPTASYTDPGALVSTTTRTVTSLAGGASSTATTKLTIPLSTPVGTYFLCGLADSTHTVIESDETNNSGCITSATLTVTASP